MRLHGIGLDVVEISRMRRLLDHHAERAVDRLFHESEHMSLASPHAPAHFAARFAAKEAFLKALGVGLSGGIRWRELWIVNGEHGEPRLETTGRARQMMDAACVDRVHVTLTHGRDVAFALVVLEARA